MEDNPDYACIDWTLLDTFKKTIRGIETTTFISGCRIDKKKCNLNENFLSIPLASGCN